jgi:hypothetical protein
MLATVAELRKQDPNAEVMASHVLILAIQCSKNVMLP